MSSTYSDSLRAIAIAQADWIKVLAMQKDLVTSSSGIWQGGMDAARERGQSMGTK